MSLLIAQRAGNPSRNAQALCHPSVSSDSAWELDRSTRHPCWGYTLSGQRLNNRPSTPQARQRTLIAVGFLVAQNHPRPRWCGRYWEVAARPGGEGDSFSMGLLWA